MGEDDGLEWGKKKGRTREKKNRTSAPPQKEKEISIVRIKMA